MLRLHRNRQQSKSGDKLDFRFSGFKALLVPKGWDKLVVSLISVGTGKTVSKTSKAAVRNGTCQWAETLSESIRVSPSAEDLLDSSKDAGSCLFKLIITMGSARSGILGEATINMMDYTSSSDSVPVSLSLKKCTHGTTLQVKIQCVTPIPKSRDNDSKKENSDSEKLNEIDQCIDTKSDGSRSDSTVAASKKSSSSKCFSLNSNPGELGSRETSFSLSESHQSYDSAEESIGGEEYSSIGDDNSRSPLKRADSSQSESYVHDFTGSSLTSADSGRSLRDGLESTAEELRVEAKMWERNARKLMADLDALKCEFSEVCDEREALRKEVERLRGSSESDVARDELRFEMEANADLTLQLKRSHESNIELVSVLKEMEETIEKQKIEIEDLKIVAENVKEHERKLLVEEETISGLMEKVRELEKDCNELTEENLELLFKLKEAKNDDSTTSTVSEFPQRTSFEFQLSERKSPLDFVDEDELTEKSHEIEKLRVNLRLKEDKISVLRESLSDLQKENLEIQQQFSVDFAEESSEKKRQFEDKLAEKSYEIEKFRENLRIKEEEISVLRQSQIDLQREKLEMKEHLSVALRETEIASQCLNDLQSSSANRELEIVHLTEVEQENVRLSVLVASFEAQIGDLSIQLERSKSHSDGLNDEACKLRIELQSRNDEISITKCQIDELERRLSSFVAEFTSREKILASEMSHLFDENSRHIETIDQETSRLEYDNARLESDFREIQSKVGITENEIKTLVSDLELRLTVSEYQRQQLSEESRNFEDELGETKDEREKLEALVRALSEERDDLKTEKSELIDKVSSLNTKLVQMEQHNATSKALNSSKINTKVSPVHEATKISKTVNQQRRDTRRNQSPRENGCESPNMSPRNNRADTGSKIQSLEDRLAIAMEENSKYKAQLDKLVSETRNVDADVLIAKSVLEAELWEIRERYSSMSLKYAEVEAQREELVMKLKTTTKSSKRWFS